MGKPVASRPPAATEWTDSRHEAVVSLALDRIEAAAWLLDQISVGELSFLDDKNAEVPCWVSEVSASPVELSGTLQRWAIASISAAVQEARTNLPSVAAAPKAVA